MEFFNISDFLDDFDDFDFSDRETDREHDRDTGRYRRGRAPRSPVDVMESSKTYIFQADVPGVKSSDIKVQVAERVLTVRAKRRKEFQKAVLGEEEVKEDLKIVRVERRPFKFFRRFSLPPNADAEKITAGCRDGVLTVTVQKMEVPEGEKPKVISVQVE